MTTIDEEKPAQLSHFAIKQSQVVLESNDSLICECMQVGLLL